MSITTEDAQALAIAQVRLTALADDVRQMQQSLRELAAIVTRLALIEQQQLQVTQSIARAFSAIEAQNAQIAEMRESLPNIKRTSAWVDRAVVAVVTLVLTVVVQRVLT